MKRKKLSGILLTLAMAAGLMLALSVTAYANPVTLWIGGHAVDNTGTSSGDGWSYVASSNTLTLNNANITSDQEGINYTGDRSLNIVLSPGSDNKITTTCDASGIFCSSILSISGSGKMTISGKGCAIEVNRGLEINDGTIEAISENNYCIKCHNVGATVTNGTATAAGGDAGTITISGGTVTATSGREDAIEARGNCEISGGTVTASGTINGICAWNEVRISGGSVTAKASGGSVFSAGINGAGDITITDGTVNAAGTNDGIYTANGVVSVIGGTVEATGTGAASCGIYTLNEVMVSGGKLTASGEKKGMYDKVKNSITGTGWTDAKGTQGKTEIAVSEAGQTLDFKRVQFPKAEDPAPTPGSSTAKPALAAKGIAKGKTALKLTWNKVDGAASYEVWMSKCNTVKKQYAPKKVKTLSSAKSTWTKKKLKKKTAYKFYVVAKDASGNVISQSLTGHAITGNVKGNKTNAKSLKLSQSSFSLTKGGTAKINATQKKAKKGKKLLNGGHTALLRYTSDNPAVATVSADGTITAVGAGSCTVYVQTVNGIWKTAAVSVN